MARSPVSVPDQTPHVAFAASATPATEFPFSFPYWQASDLVVRTRPVGGGWTIRFDYDVVADGGEASTGFPSGKVVFTAPVANVEVLVRREKSFERVSQFPAGVALDLPSLNRDINRAVGMLQTLRMELARALKLPVNSELPGDGVEIPESGVGTSLLGLDQDGNVSLFASVDALGTNNLVVVDDSKNDPQTGWQSITGFKLFEGGVGFKAGPFNTNPVLFEARPFGWGYNPNFFSPLSGSINGPDGVNNYLGIGYGGNENPRAVEIALGHGRFYFRIRDTALDSWGAWRELWHEGNVPATATRWPTIVEVNGKQTLTPGTGLSGSNYNGEAARTFSVTYGTEAGTAAQGNDSRLSNSREWTGSTISQAEAEAGTATTRRAFTAQRVQQAINKKISVQSSEPVSPRIGDLWVW